MDYPVQEVVPQLRDTLQRNPVVILQTPPGAGKSTIVPIALLEEDWLHNSRIIMLQPRRLATRAVAERMAELRGESCGETVGYRIRFESWVSKSTRIEVVTEGILTNMLQSDPTLEGIGLVIFDEFHERNLQTDLALVLCRQVQHLLRDDLRILIMSATLDGEYLSERLSKAPIITSTGRQFPVDIQYLEKVSANDRLSNLMAQAITRALREEEGDILAFLPGTGDIRQTAERLEAISLKAIVYPLYGDLPFNQQRSAILPDTNGRRKVVLATSIAETSLTIEGIRIVIDSGYSRIPRYDPHSGLTKLETVRVTLDSATQRTGRAGRLTEGVCYRLWTKAQHYTLAAQRNPEILDADLTSLVLQLKAWGVSDILSLDWITPPPAGTVRQSIQLLMQLDALDDEGMITARGRKMATLPTHPRLAHMLLESGHSPKLLALATDLAALLEERDPLSRDVGTDISLRIECLRQWRSGQRTVAERSVLERIERLASSWRKQFGVVADNTSVNHYWIGSRIALAFPERIAQQRQPHSERYKLANSRTVLLPQHDHLVREPWIVAAHLDTGEKEGKVFLAAPLDEQDLDSLAQVQEAVRWNDATNRVEGVIEKRIGNLVLHSTPMKEIPIPRKRTVLVNLIRERGLSVLGWNDACEAWQSRVMSLRTWRPDEAWPDVTEEHLLKTLDEWLLPYLDDVTKGADLQRLDLPQFLQGLLDWKQQQQLDKLVPERVDVPSGSKIRLQYFSDGRAPVLEVRLQEVFGLLDTPMVNEGRNKVILHLLSPGYKPVQVTQDLNSFWRNTYHEVRKELRARYPKHAWPEDPWTAKAVRGVVRRS
jgi:ATP-dependent helicase HrpB